VLYQQGTPSVPGGGAEAVGASTSAVKVTGKTIRQIFEEHGESMFRELEVEAVKKALTLDEHVVALGVSTRIPPVSITAADFEVRERGQLQRIDTIALITADPAQGYLGPFIWLRNEVKHVQRFFSSRRRGHSDFALAQRDFETRLSERCGEFSIAFDERLQIVSGVVHRIFVVRGLDPCEHGPEGGDDGDSKTNRNRAQTRRPAKRSEAGRQQVENAPLAELQRASCLEAANAT